MTQFLRVLLAHRRAVACLVLISLLWAAYSARTIRVRFQFRDFYDYPENPQLAVYERDFAEFGDSFGYLVVKLETPDAFSPVVIDYIRRLTNSVEAEHAIFARVRSLTNVQAIRASGDTVVTGPLIARDADSGTLASVRSFALASPLFSPRFVSSDGKVTAVLAEMRTPSTLSSIPEQRTAIDRLRAIVAKIPAPVGVNVSVTGAPAIQVGVTTSLLRDQMVLMPAVLAVLSLVLLLTFRSVHGVVFCLTSIGAATIWTAGLFALFNRPIDIIGSLIPTTILVYGAVDPIFVLTRVLAKLDAGRDKLNAILEAFSELALPCFLTSLTTALGFAAFITARQGTIRYFGLTVAVGVLLAWLTSIVILPLLIWWVPLPKRRFSAITASRWVDHVLRRAWEGLRHRVVSALALVGVILVLGSWAASKQTVDNVYVSEMPSGPAQDDVRRLERKLAGVLSLAVYLEGPPGVMKEPAVLQRVEGIQQELAKEPLVTTSTSLADLVAEAHQAFNGGDSTTRRVPVSRRLIAQYLALIDPGVRGLFATEDYAHAHLVALLADAGSERTRAVASRLQRSVDRAHFGALGVKASLTGSGIVAYRELDSVVMQLIYGFVTAFGVIVALQWLVFRSLTIALVSIIPNSLPVIACFLSLRWFHIPLQIDTALVLCISVGGLFNTTIHFAARTRQLVSEGQSDPDLVIGRAMRTVGPPALFTALALSAGFAVLLLSRFPGLRALGLLSMITLMVGFVSDMLVTAPLLRIAFDWKAQSRKAVPHTTVAPDLQA